MKLKLLALTVLIATPGVVGAQIKEKERAGLSGDHGHWGEIVGEALKKDSRVLKTEEKVEVSRFVLSICDNQVPLSVEGTCRCADHETVVRLVGVKTEEEDEDDENPTKGSFRGSFSCRSSKEFSLHNIKVHREGKAIALALSALKKEGVTRVKVQTFNAIDAEALVDAEGFKFSGIGGVVGSRWFSKTL